MSESNVLQPFVQNKNFERNEFSLNVAAEPKCASSCLRLRLAHQQQRGQAARPLDHHESSAPCRCASRTFRRFMSAYLRLGKPL